MEETTMGFTGKAKGKAEAAKGDTKRASGKATGNEQWQAEGNAEKVKGNLRQAAAKVKDAFKR
jgi:uncharacterized protein YjbJ (UPF0337 family)